MTTYQENSLIRDPMDVHTPAAYTSMVAATTSYTLYSITTGNKAKIRKLMVTNRTGTTGFLRIGRTSASFVQVFPDIWIPTGLTMILTQEELPDYWFREYGDAATDIIAQASVGAASPTDIQVFVSVIESGLG